MMRALLPLLALAAPVQSADDGAVVRYASVGGWNVFIDMALDHSCYLVGTFASGTMVSFGADRRPGDGAGYLVVANPAWKGFAEGGTYPLTMRYDAQKPWRGTAKASILDGTTALTVRFTDAAFARQFTSGRALAVDYGRTHLARLDLGTSRDAIRSMIACQGEVDSLVRDMDDQDADPGNGGEDAHARS